MTALEALNTPRQVKLTVEDFLLLDRSGAFSDYAKSELVDGTIFVVNAQYRLHARAKSRLAFALEAALKPFPELDVLVEVGVELPGSVLEPDIVVTDEPEGDGLLPLRSVHLVVEVADRSLSFDLGEKAAIYAAHGVREYWVVDLHAKLVHQLWSPGTEGYAERGEVKLGERIEARTIAGLGVETES